MYSNALSISNDKHTSGAVILHPRTKLAWFRWIYFPIKLSGALGLCTTPCLHQNQKWLCLAHNTHLILLITMLDVPKLLTPTTTGFKVGKNLVPPFELTYFYKGFIRIKHSEMVTFLHSKFSVFSDLKRRNILEKWQQQNPQTSFRQEPHSAISIGLHLWTNLRT